jgi:hypothetical protein
MNQRHLAAVVSETRVTNILGPEALKRREKNRCELLKRYQKLFVESGSQDGPAKELLESMIDLKGISVGRGATDFIAYMRKDVVLDDEDDWFVPSDVVEKWVEEVRNLHLAGAVIRLP